MQRSSIISNQSIVDTQMILKKQTSTLFRSPRAFISHLMVIGLLFLSTISQAQAGQEQFDEDQVKSVFLYNLTNFVFWPEGSFTDSENPFIITILGGSTFVENLQLLTQGEHVGRHPIQINQISKIEDLGKCHLLFIHEEFNSHISSILEKSSQIGLLTVSDYQDFCQQGGAVNLLIKSKHLNLEINIAAAQQNKLKFNAKLLQLATLVETKSP